MYCPVHVTAEHHGLTQTLPHLLYLYGIRVRPVERNTVVLSLVSVAKVAEDDGLWGNVCDENVDLLASAIPFQPFKLRRLDVLTSIPLHLLPQPNLFVAQVVGESMNRRIRNGSWCLFRAKPEGTREGKVVVAQLRSLADPETGGQYTIKLYSSEKITSDDGEWAHRRITLRPDSNQSGFAPLVFDQSDSDSDLAIVAEMLMVLAEPKT